MNGGFSYLFAIAHHYATEKGNNDIADCHSLPLIANPSQPKSSCLLHPKFARTGVVLIVIDIFNGLQCRPISSAGRASRQGQAGTS